MKILSIICLLSMIICSCELVELNEPNNESEKEIRGPEGIPSSLEVYNTYLHNNSFKTYQAISFTIASIEGFQDCRLDDVIEIKSDGTYSYDGGSVLCGAEDTERYRSGTWTIIDDGRAIIFDQGTPEEYLGTVSGLDESAIALSGSYAGLAIKGIYTAEK